MASLEILEVLDTKPVRYKVICNDCKSDPELNGDAIYLIGKDKYEKGQLPCSCSGSPKRSKEQYEVLVKRACKDSGFTFHGWHGEFCGRNSRITVECPRHGILPHKALNDFLGGRRCIECRRDNVKAALKKPDEELIHRFRCTGSYHENTTFIRSDRVTPRPRYREGAKSHWTVTCGYCGETNETYQGDLLTGSRSCSCSVSKQKYSYIHKVLGDSGEVVAVKFGITSYPKKRLLQQDLKSSLTITQAGLWEFEDYHDCRGSEKEIKQSIPCKLISRADMQDGWTETCDATYESLIISTYEKYGGRRIL